MLLTSELFPFLALTHGAMPSHWLFLKNQVLQRPFSYLVCVNRITLLCTVLWNYSKMIEIIILYVNVSTLERASYFLFLVFRVPDHLSYANQKFYLKLGVEKTRLNFLTLLGIVKCLCHLTFSFLTASFFSERSAKSNSSGQLLLAALSQNQIASTKVRMGG